MHPANGGDDDVAAGDPGADQECRARCTDEADDACRIAGRQQGFHDLQPREERQDGGDRPEGRWCLEPDRDHTAHDADGEGRDQGRHRWVDADLREPALLTAYQGDEIVYTTLVIKGRAISPTPMGTYRIIRRVANEIMDSATLGIPRNSPRGYYLTNVLYTQYFHGSGAAIHYNYWGSEFGYAGSNGCLGLNLEDSLWFWNWAGMGTVVNIHA